MLLTAEELLALANLLSRAPMSPAEQLWTQALINRLDAARAAAANAAAQQQPARQDQSSSSVVAA